MKATPARPPWLNSSAPAQTSSRCSIAAVTHSTRWRRSLACSLDPRTYTRAQPLRFQKLTPPHRCCSSMHFLLRSRLRELSRPFAARSSSLPDPPSGLRSSNNCPPCSARHQRASSPSPALPVSSRRRVALARTSRSTATRLITRRSCAQRCAICRQTRYLIASGAQRSRADVSLSRMTRAGCCTARYRGGALSWILRSCSHGASLSALSRFAVAAPSTKRR
mmetsp:Transcript_14684/g.39321  ORF Transcript_14684/g.39321 Transcript_14684/m.39321 type:complete len:222 (-) Transcript_14684:1610-2275(-)